MLAPERQHDLLQRYGPLVDCIADLLGPGAEVVLHDVSAPDHSIIQIRNGHVTGRSVGAPLTDLGFYMLRESERRIETLGIYQSTTDDGKKLKCNAANLRDPHGNIEAILCINIDVVASETQGIPDWGRATQFTEHYQNSVDQVIRTMITDVSDRAANGLTREQKCNIVRALDAHGVFLARGAVKQVASSLRTAIPTVYKYIQLARRTRASSRRAGNYSGGPATRPASPNRSAPSSATAKLKRGSR
ncbi:MAG TPA: PAS domain-containing protein [Candidatus Dormibacteraeota bacterium]|nr:PAS domain-containing protein [Candidatus Dormibacteraeota bacterium]